MTQHLLFSCLLYKWYYLINKVMYVTILCMQVYDSDNHVSNISHALVDYQENILLCLH